MAPSTEGRGGNDMRIKASSMEFRKMPQAPIFVESCSSSFLLQITCGSSDSDNNNNSSDSARVSGKCLAKHRFYHCCSSVRPVFHPITWWYASSIRSHSLWASIKWFRVSFPLYLSLPVSLLLQEPNWTRHDCTVAIPQRPSNGQGENTQVFRSGQPLWSSLWPYTLHAVFMGLWWASHLQKSIKK